MNSLKIENLTVRAGNFTIDNLSLSLEPGEYFVLMGATGSGKSLLVKTICGLQRPVKGKISIGNNDITALPPRQRNLGYVPQDSLLFPHLNVSNNIFFATNICRKNRDDRVAKTNELIEMFGLQQLLKRIPVTLSGGEQQKTALVRAMAANPRILLLDEPVSALDEPTRKEFCALLKNLREKMKMTTIHVCHSIAEAESVADRVGIMAKGRLLQIGTIAQLRLKPATPEVSRIVNNHD